MLAQRALKVVEVSVYCSTAILLLVLLASELTAAHVPATMYVAPGPDLTAAQDAAVNAATKAADVEFHNGSYPGAIANLIKVVAIDPGDIETWSSIAWLAWSISKDSDRSLSERVAWQAYGTQVLNACVAANSGNPAAWAALADFRKKAGRPIWEVYWPLKRAVSLGGDLQIRKDLGFLLNRANLDLVSRKYWRHLAANFPGDPGVRNGLRQTNNQADGLMLLWACVAILFCRSRYYRS